MVMISLLNFVLFSFFSFPSERNVFDFCLRSIWVITRYKILLLKSMETTIFETEKTVKKF